MARIGTVYKKITANGLVVNNVPYKKYDTPCWEGCCENELRISLRTSHQVAWLLYHYMPNQSLTVYNYDDWSADIEAIWREELRMKQEAKKNG